MIITTPVYPDADFCLNETTPGGSASVTLWWSNVPSLPGEKIGVIGGFTGNDPAATAAVLAEGERLLREQGCTLAVGPMDGNTWRKYRLVTDAGTEPPFLLEPTNPAEWSDWWRAGGFGPLAEYYSTASDDLTTRDPRLAGVRARLAKAGVVIRKLDTDCFEAELEKIYEVSVVSFQENYLYTPLPKPAFLGQYAGIRERVRPELVLLAEHEGRPVGYVFALPDYAQAGRGVPVDTFIVKTLAVLPGRAWAGLGALLLGEVHEAALQQGFKRVIHALMHEGNTSRNLSSHYAQTIRRYTLFSKRLAPASAAEVVL